MRWFPFWPRPRREVQLSIIVPMRAKVRSVRRAHWKWLKAYYSNALPNAEIVTADSGGRVFSKTVAVNRAVRKSHGRILAIVDADAYLDADIIQYCADRLDHAAKLGHRRWFIPYRRLYRLTALATNRIVHSDPTHPLRLPSPPNHEDIESTVGSMHGRRYGAMLVIYPRAAFDEIGGMDARFRGWGGEDVAFARALDTLWGNHKTVDADILHLWHPKIGSDFHTRMWGGQTKPEPNNHLASRYGAATGDRARMRALVDEGLAPR